MSKLLFPQFLDNEDEYRRSVEFWEQLVSEVASSLDIDDSSWRPWVPRVYADGKTPIDTPGNPMIDRRSDTLGRAFQVIQHRAVEEDADVAAWISRYEHDDAYDLKDFPRVEMFIALSLSEETALTARRLLTSWMSPETPIEDTERLISSIGLGM
jgi:hypothetical protein